MSEVKRDDATERQVRAADPAATTWLSANAGSGKTRVLTDRVARLLLNGTEPQHILCLTYTKAAATEMQNRLFRRLCEWAMKPDAGLRADLLALGEDGLTPDHLAQARRLFARAIETPGGLRIQTIHSFCATLLRRFPLEAGVSPQFVELDDRAARLLREEIVEELALTRRGVMEDVARHYAGEDFAGLMEEVAGNAAAFEPMLDEAAARAMFGAAPDDSPAAVLADVFLGAEADLVSRILPVLLAGSSTDQKVAATLSALPMDAPGPGGLAALEGLFLTGAKAKEPFTAKIGSLPTKATRAALDPADLTRLEEWMARVERARPRRLALTAAERTAVLHRFAAAFLPLYAARKAAHGWLDFDDLIWRAKALLTDPSVAAWVLFRLDGGIDHILVDEAQDTGPDQWRVIELLAAEFTAGEGAQQGSRTLFVVGDKKQSIYSFQGADVAAFDAKAAVFEARFRAAGLTFRTEKLEHSFRSSPAVLGLVDAVFAGADAAIPRAMGEGIAHIAQRTGMPGRVDLWPLVEPAGDTEEDDWENPVDLIAVTHHAARLARDVAAEIRAMIEGGVQIPDQGGIRPCHAGDFLILVQRRSAIFAEIIDACKREGLAIAGADRLKLGAELAVKDIAALLSFLALPEDDLSLATALRSPLCGWSEAELYDLAQGRGGYLWQALRNHDRWPGTRAMLADLRDHAYFLRPYELIERALTRWGGRQRLVARLGAEAEDGIDELLSQALSYERTEVPGLTGFLTRLQTDEVDVKRQMESEGRRIRVMTVHGSKGLEAPIVILPDTADRKPRDRDEVHVLGSGAGVWRMSGDEAPDALAAARAVRAERTSDENLRLLYVALTRARYWLIVCGAGEAKSDAAWHNMVAAGMGRVGAAPGPGGRLRFQTGDWPDSAPGLVSEPVAAVTLPPWALTPAAAPDRPARPLTPSDLGGAKILFRPGEAEGPDQAEAMRLGSLLHLLLERLPGVPRADWPAFADALGAGAQLAEATAVLDRPELAPLFAPGTLAEVAVTAPFGAGRIVGTIDRLIVAPDRVTAVDFKSNRATPGRPEDVPEGILRQMAAYGAALAAIWPGRRVDLAILWTATAVLMPLPPDLVAAAGERALADGRG